MRIQTAQSLGLPIDPTAGRGRDPHSRLAAFVDQSTVFALVKGTPMQPMCGFSDRVLRILNTLGVPYATFNILADEEIRSGAKTWEVNGGWHTFPQVYVGGEFVGGCDIVEQLYQQGELQTMVQEAVSAQGPGKLHSGEGTLATEAPPAPPAPIEVPQTARATGAGSDAVQEIAPRKVQLLGKEHFVLIDVREPDEFEHTRIQGANLVPMAEIGQRYEELPRDANLLVVCRSGGRSRRVAEFLCAKGFRHVYNLTGGTNAWAEQVGEGVVTY